MNLALTVYKEKDIIVKYKKMQSAKKEWFQSILVARDMLNSTVPLTWPFFINGSTILTLSSLRLWLIGSSKWTLKSPNSTNSLFFIRSSRQLHS